ncbi:uncharacterized protein MONOS_11099 [Monocercomonoides exilis]|uniref:uncharacterized protein n=1 Tax=Monocercomonoides exilis TaxID=2049356 RepID=UPI00355A99C1|nr:hypothetical protein MONOS_11099 [Monocercomonoides exilis]|eukprot:MONOS_11099.1-p1 / transcript=MONOS_11099.1 / gene=MONOS_11099 / organism=Monocercomonoides_exilis_PA203 / gene_product=unspecified product / transcript_product=unspecified product / location=Mono_scaffold00538:13256-15991(+) / protein_length=912 / sequence_SO=supercontig / SO=protein_coding / is_pseudo=false
MTSGFRTFSNSYEKISQSSSLPFDFSRSSVDKKLPSNPNNSFISKPRKTSSLLQTSSFSNGICGYSYNFANTCFRTTTQSSSSSSEQLSSFSFSNKDFRMLHRPVPEVRGAEGSPLRKSDNEILLTSERISDISTKSPMKYIKDDETFLTREHVERLRVNPSIAERRNQLYTELQFLSDIKKEYERITFRENLKKSERKAKNMLKQETDENDSVDIFSPTKVKGYKKENRCEVDNILNQSTTCETDWPKTQRNILTNDSNYKLQNTHDLSPELDNDSIDSSEIDSLLEANITRWTVKPIQAQLVPGIEVEINGERVSSAAQMSRDECIRKWQAEDEEYALAAPNSAMVRTMKSQKGELQDSIKKNKMQQNLDNNLTTFSQDAETNEQNSSIYDPSSKEIGKLTKKRRDIVRQQIKEAYAHKKLFGEWIKKDWIVDENETKMWEEAEQKAEQKDWEFEEEDIYVLKDGKIASKLTLEELKSMLINAPEPTHPAEQEKLEQLKKLVEKRERRAQMKDEWQGLSDLERLLIANSERYQTGPNKEPPPLYHSDFSTTSQKDICRMALSEQDHSKKRFLSNMEHQASQDNCIEYSTKDSVFFNYPSSEPSFSQNSSYPYQINSKIDSISTQELPLSSSFQLFSSSPHFPLKTSSEFPSIFSNSFCTDETNVPSEEREEPTSPIQAQLPDGYSQLFLQPSFSSQTSRTIRQHQKSKKQANLCVPFKKFQDSLPFSNYIRYKFDMFNAYNQYKEEEAHFIFDQSAPLVEVPLRNQHITLDNEERGKGFREPYTAGLCKRLRKLGIKEFNLIDEKVAKMVAEVMEIPPIVDGFISHPVRIKRIRGVQNVSSFVSSHFPFFPADSLSIIKESEIIESFVRNQVSQIKTFYSHLLKQIRAYLTRDLFEIHILEFPSIFDQE